MKALALAYLTVMCTLGAASVVSWATSADSVGPALVLFLALSVLTGLAAIALIPGGSDQ